MFLLCLALGGLVGGALWARPARHAGARNSGQIYMRRRSLVMRAGMPAHAQAVNVNVHAHTLASTLAITTSPPTHTSLCIALMCWTSNYLYDYYQCCALPCLRNYSSLCPTNHVPSLQRGPRFVVRRKYDYFSILTLVCNELLTRILNLKPCK